MATHSRNKSFDNYYIRYAIGDIIKKLAKNNISVVLSNKRRVEIAEVNNMKVHGYFDETNRRVVVATYCKELDWLLILLHEYSHVCQFLENIDIWSKSSKVDYKIDDWLSGTDYTKKEIKEAFNKLVKVELDCEKRTVNLIKRYSLNVNIEKEIQRMNSYLYFYEICRRIRKWYKKAPYDIFKIVNIMPYTFQKNYNKLPMQYEKLVRKHCL